jgi:hypothetical protein
MSIIIGVIIASQHAKTAEIAASAKVGDMAFNVQRNIGMLLLAIWLILSGIAGMSALMLPSPLMAVLALLAGILILVGR